MNSNDSTTRELAAQALESYKEALQVTRELILSLRARQIKPVLQNGARLSVQAAEFLWTELMKAKHDYEMAVVDKPGFPIRPGQQDAVQALLLRCIAVNNSVDWEKCQAVDVPLTDSEFDDVVLYKVRMEMSQRGKTAFAIGVLAAQESAALTPVLRLISPYGNLVRAWKLRFDKTPQWPDAAIEIDASGAQET